jgi:hypothetical protein
MKERAYPPAAERAHWVVVTLQRILSELATRYPAEDKMVPDLERIRLLCDLLGSPNKAYPAIHLTGTNGKSSTARMVDALLQGFGLRPGRYTSPHLDSVTERITIDGQPISEERFTDLWDELAPFVELVDSRMPQRMTFFEVLTAMAFAAFADAPVDVAVLEVGLGGAWDATNVVQAATAVVLPVGLDHVPLLGTTLAEIAAEKAGIIHPGATVVLAQQEPEAAEVLLRRCVEVGATVAREGLEFGVVERTTAVGGQLISLQGLSGRYDDVYLPLHGAHQRRTPPPRWQRSRRSSEAATRACSTWTSSTRVRAHLLTGPARGRAHQPHRAAGRRAQRARHAGDGGGAVRRLRLHPSGRGRRRARRQGRARDARGPGAGRGAARRHAERLAPGDAGRPPLQPGDRRVRRGPGAGRGRAGRRAVDGRRAGRRGGGERRRGACWSPVPS